MTNLTDDIKRELVLSCFSDPVQFCRVILPDWFPSKMPWFHRGILALWSGKCQFLTNFGKEVWGTETYEWTEEDLLRIVEEFVFPVNPENPNSEMFHAFTYENGKLSMLTSDRLIVMLPRGFSKTTLINAFNLWQVAYKNRKFILYLSETSTHAERQVSSVRDEIAGNYLFNELFGNLKPERTESLKWTDGFIETTNGVKLGAVGSGGQVRGYAKNAQRPDCIICDDLENQDTVRNEELTTNTRKWAMGVVEPALHKFGEERGSLFYIGTLLGEAALLPSLAKLPDYLSIQFGALDSKGEPIWEAKYNKVELEKLERNFLAQGALNEFYLEYLTQARKDDSQLFPRSKFRYAQYPREMFVAAAYAMDPAISEKRKADMAAHAVVAVTNTGNLHVLAAEGKVGQPDDEKIERLFELYEEFIKPFPIEHRRVGIEAIGYQRALIAPIKIARNTRATNIEDYAFDVIPIMHGKTAKEIRVKGIIRPLLFSGRLTFDRVFPDLEQQLENWGNGRDDVPDAVAMAINLLSDYVNLTINEDLQQAIAEEEQKPLEEWRSAP